jgi:hypothetical protein
MKNRLPLQATSAAMQLASISNVFDLLTKVTDEHHFIPYQMYNVHQSGILVNPSVQTEIRVLKG